MVMCPCSSKASSALKEFCNCKPLLLSGMVVALVRDLIKDLVYFAPNRLEDYTTLIDNGTIFLLNE